MRIITCRILQDNALKGALPSSLTSLSGFDGVVLQLGNSNDPAKLKTPNALSGTLPAFTKWQNLTVLFVAYMNISGTMPHMSRHSVTHVTGTIPESVAECDSLQYL